MTCILFVGESLRTHSLDFRIVRFIVSTNSKIQRVANTEHVTRKQLLLQCVSSVHKIGTGRLLCWLVEVVKTRQLFTNVPRVMDIIPCFEKDRFGLWFQVGITKGFGSGVTIQVSQRFETLVLGSKRFG